MAQIRKLSDKEIKAAKPADKPIKRTDGDGLYVLINPNGSKWWRFNYRFDGKHKTFIGGYPRHRIKGRTGHSSPCQAKHRAGISVCCRHR